MTRIAPLPASTLSSASPDRAGSHRLDGPERPVLVPGNGAAALGRLAEQVGEQQHEVRPHDRPGHVENPPVMHDVVEGAMAAQPVRPAAVEMRIDDPVGFDLRIVMQHPLHRGAQGFQLVSVEEEA